MTNSVTTPGRARIALAALAALAVMAALLFGGLVALAQGDRGAVPNLRLSSASPGELTISWDAPDPAPSDYRVIWAKQDLGFLSYKNSNEANRGNEYPAGNATSITLTGLTKGATFKVQARTRYTSGGDNNGPWSGPWTAMVSARVQDDPPPEPQPIPASTPQPPAAPTGLMASQVAHDSVTLTWTAPGSGTITGYRVLRGTYANSLSAIAQDTGSTDTEYTDSTVAAETTYHYAVLALGAAGDGARSTTVRATTPAAPPPVPSAPTGLTATPSHDQVSLAWDDPQDSNVAGYRIWRGADATSLASIEADTGSAATTYVDDTVTAGTAYHYAVSAINSTGTGEQSATASTTTTAAPQEQESKDSQKGDPDPNRVTRAAPGVPRNLAVMAAYGKLTFTWAAPASDGGEAINRYNHRLYNQATGVKVHETDTTASIGVTTYTYMRTGLTNGTEYRFEVRAVNSTDDSSVSGYAEIKGTPGVEVVAQFTQATKSINEGSRFNVEVTLSADPRRAVEIAFWKSHGGGASKDDYFMGTSLKRVIFMPGETRKSFIFFALRDGDADPNESVTLTLGTAFTPVYTLSGQKRDPNVSIGTRNATTITINDVVRTNYVDFGEVNYETHEFPQAVYTVLEGQSVEVRVLLRDYPRSIVTIPIMKANWAGASASDYSGVPDAVTFNTNEKSKTITFVAIDDSERDHRSQSHSDEQVFLYFGNLPPGYRGGANRFALITINDDD